MGEHSAIPLFPLNTVMYPHSKIPLYIFEERYKKLISMCIDTGDAFGVNLVIESKIHSIGCSTKIKEVIEKFPNGEMRIVAEGVKRYELLNYRKGKDGYFLGEIVYKDEQELDYEAADFTEAAELYNKIIQTAYQETIPKIDSSDIDTYKRRSASFYMAQKAGLPLEERQKVLEIDNEKERMKFLIEYFKDILPKLKDAEKISQIIKSDGYLPE